MTLIRLVKEGNLDNALKSILQILINLLRKLIFQGMLIYFVELPDWLDVVVIGNILDKFTPKIINIEFDALIPQFNQIALRNLVCLMFDQQELNFVANTLTFIKFVCDLFQFTAAYKIPDM